MNYPKISCDLSRRNIVCKDTIKEMKQLRKSGLTMTKIAEKLNVSQTTISRYLTGEKKSTIINRRRIVNEYYKKHAKEMKIKIRENQKLKRQIPEYREKYLKYEKIKYRDDRERQLKNAKEWRKKRDGYMKKYWEFYKVYGKYENFPPKIKKQYQKLRKMMNMTSESRV